jgi:hypothetical protein
MSPTNVVPDFVLMFLFLRFCFVFLMFFRTEAFLDLVSDFRDKVIVRNTAEYGAVNSKDVFCVQHKRHDYVVCIILIAISMLFLPQNMSKKK